MITDDDIDYIFSNLTERREIEFKRSINWTTSSRVRAKIAKSLMALSNIRNGGYYVIGVRQNSDHTFTQVGMSQDAYDSHNIDDVLSYVNSKAEPPIVVEIRKIEKTEGRFVIYKVYEFDNYPTFCKNGDENGALHEGVIYVRTMRMYESAPLQNQSEMREIVDMIITKHAQEYARIYRQYAGIEELAEHVDFDEEIGGL